MPRVALHPNSNSNSDSYCDCNYTSTARAYCHGYGYGATKSDADADGDCYVNCNAAAIALTNNHRLVNSNTYGKAHAHCTAQRDAEATSYPGAAPEPVALEIVVRSERSAVSD